MFAAIRQIFLKGGTIKDAIAYVFKETGNMPTKSEGMKMIDIYQDVQKNTGKVIQFPKDRITPFNKPRPTPEEINKQLTKALDEKKAMFPGSNVANDVDGIIKNLKSMEPIDAMKEANLIVGRKGQYKNLSIDESQKILKDTNDHIFSRDIQYDEFGDPIKPDPDDFASGGLARVGMFGGKLTIDALRKLVTKKYAGKIDDDLLQKMLVDDDPQRLSEVMATIDEALIMQNKGMKPDAIMDTFKESFKRKKQASGGLAKILGV